MIPFHLYERCLYFIIYTCTTVQTPTPTPTPTYTPLTSLLPLPTQSLRLDIINGSFKADHVAYLSANDLATDDIRGTRKEVANETQMARRGDLYEITRYYCSKAITICLYTI